MIWKLILSHTVFTPYISCHSRKRLHQTHSAWWDDDIPRQNGVSSRKWHHAGLLREWHESLRASILHVWEESCLGAKHPTRHTLQDWYFHRINELLYNISYHSQNIHIHIFSSFDANMVKWITHIFLQINRLYQTAAVNLERCMMGLNASACPKRDAGMNVSWIHFVNSFKFCGPLCCCLFGNLTIKHHAFVYPAEITE